MVFHEIVEKRKMCRFLDSSKKKGNDENLLPTIILSSDVCRHVLVTFCYDLLKKVTKSYFFIIWYWKKKQ